MPLFRGEVHTAHYEPGEVIEIDDDQVHLYDGDLEAGFLTSLSGGARSTVGVPDAEALSTVGHPDPE